MVRAWKTGKAHLRSGARKRFPKAALTAGFLLCSVVLFAFGIDARAQEAGREPGASADRAAEARANKRIGDRYISEDQVKLAADAYVRALDMDRNQFTLDERTQMAVYLSWDNRLDEAIHELELVLSEDPARRSARVDLARIYGWAGDLKRSIEEADRVLAGCPDCYDALLVKANAMEWQGRYGDAIALYQEIIKAEDDFDAKVGLSSSLLYKGDRAAASREAGLLKPRDPRQQRRLDTLMTSIDNETRPRFDARYNRYSDTDDNISDRYTGRFGIPSGNQEFGFSLGHTESHGRDRTLRADDFSFDANFFSAAHVGIGGAVGFSNLHADNLDVYPTGRVRIDGRFSHTLLGISMSTDMLTDTVQLIDNRIRRTSAGVDLLERINDRLSFSGAYSHMRFSDGNDADDAQLNAEFRVTLAPRLAFGYRGRYLNFERQAWNGYFDPNDYISNRLYSGLYLKRRKFYVDLEVYYGKQNFKRYGARTDDWIAGGAGSFGVTPAGGLVLEINASGGDFAAGSVSGFRYFTVGTRIYYRF